MNLQETKAKTLELLSANKIDNVDYITEELIKKNETATDDTLDSEASPDQVNVIEGHNMRYGAWTDANGYTVHGYIYERGSAVVGSGCGNAKTMRLPFSAWDHTFLGKCGDGSDLLRFTRK